MTLSLFEYTEFIIVWKWLRINHCSIRYWDWLEDPITSYTLLNNDTSLITGFMAWFGLHHTRTLPLARNNWNLNSLDRGARYQSPRVELAKVMSCARCGFNRDNQVGLLLPYLIEAKEHWLDLLDMILVSPVSNAYVIWASIVCLLPQTILVRRIW